MTPRLSHGLVFCGLLALGLLMSTTTAPNAWAQALESLRPEHPRLFATAADFQAIRDRRSTDPVLDAQLRTLEARAEALLDEPLLTPKKIGRRMLGVSRKAVTRLTTLSLARHTTGDERFARRAEAEMLNVADFPDWNPRHYLDVAEMATAVAIGYDWLYADLSEGTRAKVRDGLLRHALTVDRKKWGTDWRKKENNWNSVCYSGMVIAALAIAEHEPDVARDLLASAKANNPRGLAAYAPDGVYPEGPGYWVYGTTFQVLMVDACAPPGQEGGDDLGLGSRPRLRAQRRLHRPRAGPDGHGAQLWRRQGQPLFPSRRSCGWSTKPAIPNGSVTGDATTGPAWSKATRGCKPSPRSGGIGWTRPRRRRPPPMPAAAPALCRPRPPPRHPALSWHGQGKNPVAYFRESWENPGAMWLGVKGGRANLSHAHMDAGSFVFEADGVRWAIDLEPPGYQRLESEGLKIWDRSQKSDRWKVYVYRNDAHNTLTVGDQLMRVDATATLSDFQPFDPDTAQNGTVQIDLAGPPLGKSVKTPPGASSRSSAVTSAASTSVTPCVCPPKPKSSGP